MSSIQYHCLSGVSFVNFGGNNMIYVILLLSHFVLFLTLLSSAICVTIRNEEMTNIILSNSTAVLGFLSGIFFPIASLGAFFEKIASFSPIKWTVSFSWFMMESVQIIGGLFLDSLLYLCCYCWLFIEIIVPRIIFRRKELC